MIPKFRAWDKEKKMMNIVDGIHFDEDKVWEISCHGVCWRNIRYYILMQSTGLHDKNGKEIFEGDIVQCWYEKGFVVMRQGSWFIETDKEYLGALYEYSDEARVIGNIHEHPELLIQPNE